MPMWPDRRLLNLFRIEHPILQAPMAGAMDAELAIAVAKAGGLGALPAAMLNAEKLRAQVAQFRTATADKPVNLNFFAHRPPVPNNAREHAWREKTETLLCRIRPRPVDAGSRNKSDPV
jgi:nitronate monooxygenase